MIGKISLIVDYSDGTRRPMLIRRCINEVVSFFSARRGRETEHALSSVM